MPLKPKPKPKARRPFLTQDGTTIPRPINRTAPMPRSVYPMALDAAPQDGRWMEDPDAVARVVRFLVSKLSPADLAELDAQLTDGTAPQANDHRLPEGDLRRNWLNYTPKNRAAMRDSLFGSRPDPLAITPAERDAIHAKLFPNAGRLK